MKSEVEKRKIQVGLQLDRVRLRLAQKADRRYANEGTYKYQRKRAAQLIAELEDELSMLSCPGEYAELAVATVADELGLTYKQVRNLIKLGEIEATGSPAHERVSRAEMERIASLGGEELLRLGRQESVEIFEEAVLHLQDGNLEFAERAYRRLKARAAWGKAYTPALLLCLEIAKGEFENARESIKLIQAYADPLQTAAMMDCLRRLLKGMRLTNDAARIFSERLLNGTESAASPRGINGFLADCSEGLEVLRRRAAYLVTAVQLELRKGGIGLKGVKSEIGVGIAEERFILLLVNAVYNALYAEATLNESEASRTYITHVNSIIPTNCLNAVLLELVNLGGGVSDDN